MVFYLPKFQEQDYSFLIHVENQAFNAPEFNRRMFRYFCSLFLKYDRPKRKDASNFVVKFPDRQILNFGRWWVRDATWKLKIMANKNSPLENRLFCISSILQVL